VAGPFSTRRTRSRLTAIGLLAFGAVCAGPSDDTALHGVKAHPALAVDTALMLDDVVDATLAHYPSAVEIDARREESLAWRARSRSLTAAPHAATVRYQTDRLQDDLGLREIESGIQLSLWRWGERRSAAGVGRSLGDETDAAERALRLDVTGSLRRLLWELERLSRELALREESSAIAERVAASVARRVELGDAARRDSLLAESARLGAAARVSAAEVERVDLERIYRSITGLDRRPEMRRESLAVGEGVPLDHPTLALAAAALERANAERTLVQKSGQSRPTLFVGPRRETSSVDAPDEDSIGVIITVPFGGKVHRRTEVAAAGREVAAAESQLRATRRQLDIAYHEAAHGLDVARENLERAVARRELALEGFHMGETAYSHGEIGLVELLSLRDLYLDASLQALDVEIDVSLQTALYNQAVGVMP